MVPVPALYTPATCTQVLADGLAVAKTRLVDEASASVAVTSKKSDCGSPQPGISTMANGCTVVPSCETTACAWQAVRVLNRTHAATV